MYKSARDANIEGCMKSRHNGFKIEYRLVHFSLKTKADIANLKIRKQKLWLLQKQTEFLSRAFK